MNYLATTFTVPMPYRTDDITIEARELWPWNGCERSVKAWSICWLGNVWTKEGRWEVEPKPSGQYADFLFRARYESFEGALVAAWFAVASVKRMRRRQRARR